MKCRRYVILVSFLWVVALCLCTGCKKSNAIDTIEVFDSEIVPPKFSHETGSYDENFILTVVADTGTTVRYTLDGSMPTSDSPVFPTEGMVIADRSDEPNVLAAVSTNKISLETDHVPPTVSKGTVIRAAAFSPDGEIMSAVTTETYLVGLDYKDIKIVSLVLDSDSLFDYENGIYVMGKYYDDWMASDPEAKNAGSWEIKGNFSQKGREWEREVLFQLIENDGSFGIEQNMGIRIMGTATRTYYQKSFRLYAREEYGAKRLEYPLITGLTTDNGEQPLQKFKTFILRNGGNDNYFTLLRDPYVQALLPDRDFATQGAEPCIVFINGEYWGIYSITEDYSDNYIEDNYGVDSKNTIIVKNMVNDEPKVDEGEPTDIELYKELEGSIYWRDFTQAEHYDWLCENVDMQNLIDYMAVLLYIDNSDGAFNGNNWRVWRGRETDPENEYADGRWRFMLYDNDFALAFRPDEGGAEKNTLEQIRNIDWGWGLLFNKLMENEQFRAQFINTFMDLRNTCFRPEDALETLEEMKNVYSPYIAEQYRRNGPGWVTQMTDDEMKWRFEDELNHIRQFINGRYDYSVTMIRDGYGLGEAYNISLSTSNPEGGTVIINTVTPDLSNGLWQGKYFSEYEIYLTAAPTEGYVFTGWSGDVTEQQAEITIRLAEDMEIIANFEKR